MDDSEISTMTDQYGPGWGSVEDGTVPSANWMVGSFLEASGALLGE